VLLRCLWPAQRLSGSVDNLLYREVGGAIPRDESTRALYSPVLAADSRRPANTTRFVYLEPEAAQRFFVDYDQIARDAAAMLRLDAGRNPTTRI
jgi:MmyB-like transcription regulator ligand binding domain